MHRSLSLVVALAVVTACRTAVPVPPPTAVPQPVITTAAHYDPSRALGQLFHDVQLSGIFPDSKTFVDARPLFPPVEIVARYATARAAPGFTLRTFVEQHFELPRPAGEGFR